MAYSAYAGMTNEDLDARVAWLRRILPRHSAAERAGKTTHAFILDVLAQTVEQLDTDEEFHCLADQRWASVFATGTTVPWDEARVHFEARARGDEVRKSGARKLKR